MTDLSFQVAAELVSKETQADRTAAEVLNACDEIDRSLDGLRLRWLAAIDQDDQESADVYGTALDAFNAALTVARKKAGK